MKTLSTAFEYFCSYFEDYYMSLAPMPGETPFPRD
jgi:hypothetical protein